MRRSSRRMLGGLGRRADQQAVARLPSWRDLSGTPYLHKSSVCFLIWYLHA